MLKLLEASCPVPPCYQIKMPELRVAHCCGEEHCTNPRCVLARQSMLKGLGHYGLLQRFPVQSSLFRQETNEKQLSNTEVFN